MLNRFLFKLFFPAHMRGEIDSAEHIEFLNKQIEYLEKLKKKNFLFNFPKIDMLGDVPHYLDNLSAPEKENYVATLESMYSNPKFQDVIKYCINLHGNKAMQVAPDNEMYKYRYAILGIQKVLEEFENAHSMFVENNRKQDKDFDPLAVLPE